MTDEEEFEQLVLRRIREASQLTGYSFAGLLNLVATLGALQTAKRLIAPTPGNLGRFPKGMRKLFNAGLLSHSIEQAVIEFSERGKLFTPLDTKHATDRLEMMRVIFSKRR